VEVQAKWRSGCIFKADAQKVYEEIGDNSITPEEVIEIAKNKKSELHKCFEWDDKIAGQKFRLQQARQVLNNLVFIPVKKEEQPVRIFSYTPETGYKPTIQMVVNMDEYQSLLAQAKRELLAFERKYSTLSELQEVFDAIEAL